MNSLAPPIWGSSPRSQKVFSVLGYLIVAASILAQLFLIAMLVHISNLGPGEERGFTGMAFVAPKAYWSIAFQT